MSNFRHQYDNNIKNFSSLEIGESYFECKYASYTFLTAIVSRGYQPSPRKVNSYLQAESPRGSSEGNPSTKTVTNPDFSNVKNPN